MGVLWEHERCTMNTQLNINQWGDSMNTGKVANVESMVSCDCTSLLEHVIIMGRSFFGTDFAAQIKLTKLPLIHYFD